jgi:predicted phosphodiesterase
VLTAVVSDFHLGTARGVDLVRHPEVRVRLLEALEGADRIVLLGDALELRELPVPQALEIAAPLFRELGELAAGREVVLVGGNHDHQLIEPWLDERRLAGTLAEVGPEWIVDPVDQGVAGAVAKLMPKVELTLAYPGLWLRDDVYATHGHYLDCHMTVPRPETITASALHRSGSGGDWPPSGPAGYEAVLSPVYAFLYRLAQGRTRGELAAAGGLSRRVWRSANPRDGWSLGSLLVGRVAIPGAVIALNGFGLGPFKSDISAGELRRAGLLSIAEVVRSLGVEADHVVFGHTHRPGPLEGDSEGWTLPGGTRLWNSGSWLHESVFLRNGRASPYWPGTVLYLREEGPPELANALGDLELPTTRMPASSI